MKNIKTIAIIIVLLLVGILIYFYKNKPISPNNQTTQTSGAGCYVARLAKDVYVLTILSEENNAVLGTLAYNNFDKDSSHGSFRGTLKDNILFGEYSFDSEGLHSIRQVVFKKVGNSFIQGFGPITMVGDQETFTDIKNVTYDPKTTFLKSTDCPNVSTYSEQAGTYSFNYDPSFSVTNGDKTKPTQDWRLNNTTSGILLTTLNVPKSYMPGTNFSEAKLTIGRSTDASAVKNCTAVETWASANADALINRYTFKKVFLSDAGAGNFYDTTSYRAILDGDCYVIEYTIHSSNIGNYSPDQGIKEFDKNKIQNELETIIQSLRFQLASN